MLPKLLPPPPPLERITNIQGRLSDTITKALNQTAVFRYKLYGTLKKQKQKNPEHPPLPPQNKIFHKSISM